MAVIGVKVQLEGAPVFSANMRMLTQQTKLYQQQLKTIDATMTGTTNVYAKHIAKTQALKQAEQALQMQARNLAAEIEKSQNKIASGNGTAAEETRLMRLRTQYQRVQQSLGEVTDQISQQGGRLGAVSAQFEAIGGKFSAIGGKMQAFGGAITRATAPISVGLGASVKAAIDFESAFTGVMKTVDESATTTYKDLEEGIKKMSTTTASSKEEIAAVMEAAGQLGVPTDDILRFTETMIKLGDTTNVTAEEAAVALAKFVNVTGDGTGNVDKLGASIVALGNNFATDERSIIDMSQRLAAAGKISGLTSTDILALAASMSSVGIEAEAGGTAMSQTLTSISKAVAEPGDKLEKLAQISGMTADQFAAKWKEKPVDALQAFLKGLGDMNEKGQDTYSVLGDLGMSGIRQSNMLQSLALANENVAKAVNISTDAYKSDNEAKGKANALTEEASKRYNTQAAKISQTREKVKNLAIEVGNKLLPYVQKALEFISKAIDWFGKLSSKTQDIIIKVGAVIAVLGPIITVIGTVISVIGSVISAIGTVIGWIGTAIGWIGSIGSAIVSAGNIVWAIATTVIEFLTPIISVIGTIISAIGSAIAALNPVTLVIAAIVAAIAAVIAAIVLLFKHNEEFRQGCINAWNAVKDAVIAAAQFIASKVVEFWNFLKDNSVNIFNAVKDFIINAWNTISTAAATIWQGIVNVITTLWNGLVTVATTAFNFIKNIITTVWTTIVNVTTTVWNTIKSLISAAVNNVRNIITTVFNTLSGIISNIWNAVKNITSSAWENIKNAAVNGAHNIGNAVRSLPSEIGRILGNLGSSALKWGKDMIDGFVNGIKSKYNDVKNAVTGIGDKVKSLMHFTEPDEGPLKDFNSWAPDMIRNYAKGITDNSYLVQKAIEGVTSDVASLAGLNNQQLDTDSLYRAVNKGASDATVTAVIGDRELARKLREMGVVFE